MSDRVPRYLRPVTNPDRYKWNALSNTTLGTFIALLNQSILIISLPAIFRGIHLQPLASGNFGYLLWLLLGYMVVTAVLVVAFGKIGDQFGRVRMYNLGFFIFTIGSVCLAFSPVLGSGGALVLIALRLVQGIGGAMIMANSTAILTDAFPADQRGMALGFNIVAGITASFLGLLIGGALAGINWRLVFLVNVPVGVFGTIWTYLTLRDTGKRAPAKLDLWGNFTFAVGLILVMIALTYGIQPYGAHTMGWSSPVVLAELVGGLVFLGLCVWIENHVPEPMFHLSLFRIRAFAGAGFSSLIANMGRGGLQFMLILWLQGIWLPLHGFSFERTPLWSGIYMLPLSIGFLAAGPLSGRLSDRYGQRLFSAGGMAVATLSFLALIALPINFTYIWFALLTFLNGAGVGMFAAPNTTQIMNGVPADQRGVASGMRATFMNAGFVLSIGIFFSLMVLGLASRLPTTLSKGLIAQGVSPTVAHHVANLPPVGTLFAAFLGFNPMKTLLGSQVLSSVGKAHAATLTSKTFFPSLISGPFHFGLVIAFSASAALCATAAILSYWAGNSSGMTLTAAATGDPVSPDGTTDGGASGNGTDTDGTGGAEEGDTELARLGS
ncbi:MAG: MFS transporter [Acidimicrobiales bacterium]